MSVRKDSLTVTKIGLNTNSATESLPVRVITVDSDAPFGSDTHKRAVTAAALAVKRAEQARLENDAEEGINDNKESHQQQ